jgi:formamidopyrimidine-DNA glycosylase
MSERPELEYSTHVLDRGLKGLAIAGVRVVQPSVVRSVLGGGVETNLLHRCFSSVSRRGSSLVFALAGEPAIEMLVLPGLTGRFGLDPPEKPSPGDLALAVTLPDGRELRYRDDNQTGKIFVISPELRDRIPGLHPPGLDILNAKVFTRAVFRSLIRRRRDPAKIFLMDPKALDFVGNVYADEILFEAGIHPTNHVNDLSDERVDRLHDAAVSVLTWARDEIMRRKPPLDEKLRDFLKVRNRFGQPCQRCANRIRIASIRGQDAFFCPVCQTLETLVPRVKRPVYID